MGWDGDGIGREGSAGFPRRREPGMHVKAAATYLLLTGCLLLPT